METNEKFETNVLANSQTNLALIEARFHEAVLSRNFNDMLSALLSWHNCLIGFESVNLTKLDSINTSIHTLVRSHTRLGKINHYHNHFTYDFSTGNIAFYYQMIEIANKIKLLERESKLHNISNNQNTNYRRLV